MSDHEGLNNISFASPTHDWSSDERCRADSHVALRDPEHSALYRKETILVAVSRCSRPQPCTFL